MAARAGGVRTIGCAGMLVLAAFTSTPALVAQAPRREYVGVKKCSLCHAAPLKGAQYQKWAASKHALAWRVLGTEMARETASKLGVADPRKSDRCLGCHVTAHGVKEEFVSQGVRPEDGVGCEACHGPGSDYARMDVMADRRDAVARGLVVPDEKVCGRCHNDRSPTFRPFEYEARLREIAHRDPTRQAR